MEADALPAPRSCRRRRLARWLRRSVASRVALACVVFLIGTLWSVMVADGLPRGQRDAATIDAVIPAAVQIAVRVDRISESGSRRTEIITRGSGTIISADGLILTAAHVVDLPTLRTELRAKAADDSLWFGTFEYALYDMQLLILGTDGYSLPQPRYTAAIVSSHQTLDVAFLQIVGDDLGLVYDPRLLDLPYVPLASSATLDLGEEVTLLGYPGMAGGGLLTTTGIVSGFRFDADRDPRHPTAILVDAIVSGGSSGGTAINVRGELIGLPLAATILTCGAHDHSDESTCLPSGGSVTKLLPISEVREALAVVTRATLPRPATPTATP